MPGASNRAAQKYYDENVDISPAAPGSVFGRGAWFFYFISGIRERWRTQLSLQD